LGGFGPGNTGGAYPGIPGRKRRQVSDNTMDDSDVVYTNVNQVNQPAKPTATMA